KNNFNVEFIAIDKLTEGTACTVLYARKYINNDTSLMIANSDQIVDIDITDFINDSFKRGLDGSILTFVDKEKNSKWSFAKLNNDLVVEVKEKEAISEFATVGIYFFNKGKIFVESAIDMIVENDRVNNEFYICPVYNYTIKNGAKIGIYNIDFSQMHGIGTPEDLEKYQKNNKLDLIIRDQCPITYNNNIEIISSRQFPLFCGCTDQDLKKDIICEEQFAICQDSGVLFLNKLIPLDILYKNGHYAGNIGKIWDEHHREFAKFIFQIKPKNILEIGGGHGKLSQFFLEMDNVNWTIVEPNIENKFENVNYIDGFFNKDICNNEQYDVIIHSHVLEHIYNPNEFFSEISSFLDNDKGYMVFSIPNMSKWLKNKYSNCLFFEHTILLDENIVDYILGNNNFTIITKKYFKEHSIFYLVKKDIQTVKINLKNKYLENKTDFEDMLKFYKNKVQYINSYIKQTSKKVYLFG
ncbi:dTDP-glucose pyrophosphorylase, partial [Campylobacter jejuni]|nr:dTDP-glucose pyrophosphorylase [Campylobacter jejuni]